MQGSTSLVTFCAHFVLIDSPFLISPLSVPTLPACPPPASSILPSCHVCPRTLPDLYIQAHDDSYVKTKAGMHRWEVTVTICFSEYGLPHYIVTFQLHPKLQDFSKPLPGTGDWMQPFQCICLWSHVPAQPLLWPVFCRIYTVKKETHQRILGILKKSISFIQNSIIDPGRENDFLRVTQTVLAHVEWEPRTLCAQQCVSVILVQGSWFRDPGSALPTTLWHGPLLGLWGKVLDHFQCK